MPKPDYLAEPPLVINRGARIAGDVAYRSNQTAWVVDKDSISGQLYRENLEPGFSEMKYAGLSRLWMMINLISLFSALVLGLVMIHFFRRQVLSVSDAMAFNARRGLFIGMVFLVLTPLVCVLIFFTVLGIPLAFILFMIWLLVILLSKPLIGIMIGKTLWHNYRHKVTKARKQELSEAKLFYPMIVGIIVTSFIFAIPFVGGILSFIAVSWLIGSVWIAARTKNKILKK